MPGIVRGVFERELLLDSLLEEIRTNGNADPERLLVYQRNSGQFAGQWEFTGGKIEEGESAVEA